MCDRGATSGRTPIRPGANPFAAAPAPRILPAMNLLRIDHVSLNAADREATVAWYAEVLGLRAGAGAGATPPEEPVFLGAPGAQLGLFGDRAPGLRHIALATDAAGQAAVRERLERLGTPGRFERHRDHHSLYVPDPDGAMVEVMVPVV
jgi:catechol 2,3-dioxygenase-like lactoylglutathione lyase family enzyme